MRFLRFLVVVASLLLLAGCANDDDATAPIVDFKDGLTDIQLGQGATTYKLSALIISEVSRLSQVRVLRIDEYGETMQIGKVITDFDQSTYQLEVDVPVVPGVQFFDVEAVNLDAAMTVRRMKVTVAGPIALSSVATFTLGYPSSTDNPKARYGVTYDLNYTEKSEARFVGQFVLLTQSEFNAVTHRQVMINSYENGSKVDRFDAKLGVAFETIYFVVRDGEIYRLVEMTGLNSTGSGSNITSVAQFNERH